MEIGGVNFSIALHDARDLQVVPGVPVESGIPVVPGEPYVPGKTPYLLQEHDPNYAGFFRKANQRKNKDARAGTIDININLAWENLPETGKLTKIFDSGQSWQMYREGDIYWAVLHPPAHEKPLWAARFYRDVKEVTVYCSRQYIQKKNGKTIILNPVRYPLDQLLIMYSLAQHRGAVIHAAGIEMRGKGFIFAGPSGAGKSTLARWFNTSREQNHPGVSVLSDERIVTREINGLFKAYGTPWHGEEGTTRNKSAPLTGIFFLNHAKENMVTQLNPQQALDKLLKVTSIPWYDREVMPGILRFCDDLLTRVPLFELHFTPGLEVVSFLEKNI